MGIEKEYLVLLKQIINIDKKCIGKKITKLSPRLMSIVDKKINLSLGIRKPNRYKKERS